MSQRYLSGLPTTEHDKIDVREYFSLVDKALCHHRRGLIVDLFSGGGRDITNFWTHLHGEGKFLAIDGDRERIKDILKRNNHAGPIKYSEVHNVSELTAAFRRRRIAVLKGRFPQKPFGATRIDLKGQVNFALCNAGIMFIPPGDLKRTLYHFGQLLAPKAEMFLRFSQEREDQRNNANYYIHKTERVMRLLRGMNLRVRRNPDLPDPSGRGFSWVDLKVAKPG